MTLYRKKFTAFVFSSKSLLRKHSLTHKISNQKANKRIATDSTPQSRLLHECAAVSLLHLCCAVHLQQASTVKQELTANIFPKKAETHRVQRHRCAMWRHTLHRSLCAAGAFLRNAKVQIFFPPGHQFDSSQTITDNPCRNRLKLDTINPPLTRRSSLFFLEAFYKGATGVT